jgi:hypothetical protein
MIVASIYEIRRKNNLAIIETPLQENGRYSP